MIWLVAVLVALLAVLAWGIFEAGWVRLVELEASIPGLPEELDGLRVAHLSDFHLGVHSRGRRAVRKAVDWVCERKPDLVLVSGDLLSRPRGEVELRRLLGRLENCFVVLGNHDFAHSRDPFSQPSAVAELEPAHAALRRGAQHPAAREAGSDSRRRSAHLRREAGRAAAPCRPRGGAPNLPLPLPGHRRGACRRGLST